ncbi:MAG TPA: hypothetical protein PLB25_21295, partial [Rhodoferax sp.]|nr:hypothetical protein [Rhodoferax sp.]
MSGAQLCPNQPSFNGLAQTHLIRNQNAVAGRFQEVQNRLELVGQEFGISRVQAVNQVCQLAAQTVVRNGATQVHCPAIEATQHQIVGI